MSPDIAHFVALERRVWQALADGDAAAEHLLLDADFLGVYASGFAAKSDHAAQLDSGPRVDRFSIEEPRLISLAPDAVLLSYRAIFTRPEAAGVAVRQAMYVSSVWKRHGMEWVNIFSQDTVASRAPI